MAVNQRELLDLFFHLPQSQVDADLAAATANPRKFMTEHLEQPRVPIPKQTAGDAAYHHHRELIFAAAYQSLPHSVEDLSVYTMGMAATHLIEVAVQVASGEGELARLAAEIKAIEQREGLTDDQYYPIGEGPADHLALNDAYDARCAAVEDAFIPRVLRRYRFDEFADLYEQDRMGYEVRLVVGRRLAHSEAPPSDTSAEVEQFEERNLLERFGPEAHDLLQRRLTMVGLSD